MSTSRHIDQEDLALFSMQLLSKDENSAILAHLEHCSECGRLLAQIQGDLAVYAHTVDMHSPPAQARERLLKQIAREKKSIPIDRAATLNQVQVSQGYRTGLGSGAYLTQDEHPIPSLAARLFPWAGWAVAAGLAIASGSLYHERESLQNHIATQTAQLNRVTSDAASAREIIDMMTDPTAMRVTLTKTPTSPTPQGKATYNPQKGALIFQASNMDPLQPYKTYELWLIPADGRDPIPAGTFRPDERGNASVIMPPLPKGVEAKAFGVTIEDESGAQAPTLPIIIAGS